jgi:hypothetical protein
MQNRIRVLRKGFNELAKHGMIYRKAILENNEINAYDKIESYEEIYFTNVALNSASDRTKLYSVEYDSKLYARFLVQSDFEVNKIYDKVLIDSKEYKITDFSFLEQIPGLRKCELEIEPIP